MPGIKKRVDGCFLTCERKRDEDVTTIAEKNDDITASLKIELMIQYINQPKPPVNPQYTSSFLGTYKIIENERQPIKAITPCNI